MRASYMGFCGAVALALSSSCLAATDFDVVVDTDIDCSRLGEVDIVAGVDLAPASPAPNASATKCNQGHLGDIVLVPTNKDSAVLVQVTAGVGATMTSDCLAALGGGPWPTGCVVARRIVRYVEHASLQLPITLYGKCIGVPCDQDKTCDQTGMCVPATTPCPTSGCGMDAGDCGGVACEGTCTAGRCLVTLASGQMGPAGIAVDATRVYWTTETDGAIRSVPLTGGTPSTIATGQGVPLSVVVDATSAYWTTNTSVGGVEKAPLGGGTGQALAAGEGHPIDLAVDATNVYWVDSTGGTVNAVPIGGGQTRLWGNTPMGSERIAIDATDVYWTNVLDATIRKASPFGGVSVLEQSQVGALGITVDATNVYWTTSNSVMSAPKAGGPPVTIASAVEPSEVRVDAQSVYWINNVSPGGSVMKAPLGGGAPVTLATGLGGPFRLALDATSVYWTNYDDGTVVKLTPK